MLNGCPGAHNVSFSCIYYSIYNVSCMQIMRLQIKVCIQCVNVNASLAFAKYMFFMITCLNVERTVLVSRISNPCSKKSVYTLTWREIHLFY